MYQHLFFRDCQFVYWESVHCKKNGQLYNNINIFLMGWEGPLEQKLIITAFTLETADRLAQIAWYLQGTEGGVWSSGTEKITPFGLVVYFWRFFEYCYSKRGYTVYTRGLLWVNNFFKVHFQKYWPKQHVCVYCF